MLRRSLLVAALLSVASTGAVLAQAQQNFSLINRTGHQINEVYVSPSANSNWGRDILGEGVMPTNTRRNITFPRSTQACMFDLRVVYEDGEKADMSNIDLCKVSNVTLTYSGGNTRYSAD
ncbi:MAG: hypothetical protein ACRCVA_34860 [Phreatobacter sp.]